MLNFHDLPLDVNALIAFGLHEHEWHDRVARWVKEVVAAEQTALATCAVTGLGFLRILIQAPSYSFTIAQGKTLLSRLKMAKGLHFTFLADDQGIADLPLWVRGPKQITDGHLLGLAKKHGARLATLDEQIPGAMLIPRKP